MRSRLAIGLVVLSGAMALAQGQAAPPQAQAPAGGPGGAPQVELKNIQVLKGMSHDDVLASMRFITQALGTNCAFCHVEKEGRLQPDLDEKETKKVARQMLTMTKGINDQYFDGRQRVTCASCHNGHGEPRPYPPIADVASLKERIDREQAQRQREQMAQNRPPAQPGAPAGANPPQRPAGPTAAAIFAKYEQAIGGAEAIDKLTSETAKYTTVNPATSNTGSGEFVRKAPDKVVSTTTFGERSQTMGFDGNTGWQQSPRGVQPATGPTAEQLKFVANFWRDLKPSDRYSQARAGNKIKLDGKDVYVVRGAVKGTKIQEQLYFDADSGLLLRRLTFTPTPLGPVADQVDFDDYRAVDGVKVPFKLTASVPDSITVRTYSSIEFNTPVDDAKFSMPSGGGKQAQ